MWSFVEWQYFCKMLMWRTKFTFSFNAYKYFNNRYSKKHLQQAFKTYALIVAKSCFTDIFIMKMGFSTTKFWTQEMPYYGYWKSCYSKD